MLTKQAMDCSGCSQVQLALPWLHQSYQAEWVGLWEAHLLSSRAGRAGDMRGGGQSSKGDELCSSGSHAGQGGWQRQRPLPCVGCEGCQEEQGPLSLL